MGVALGPLADGVPRRVPHGEVIAHQGQDVRSLFLVTEGAVRLASVTAAGREAVLALLGPGDVFGEWALLDEPSPVEARAVGPTRLVGLPVASIRTLMERRPEAAEQLLRLLASRLHRTRAALELALVGDIRARVAARLRELASTHGVAGRGGVRLGVPLTQGELARMVGTSRETVNRTVGALTARGLLRSAGPWMVISDPTALEDVAPDPGDRG
ncbi:MAG TPA: Crp/Fnr family transcriptional regulator [Actinomycetota bacterium]|nr:Crp/Fnr family transcriptional regulator [Actinomycetota bacterium]